MRKRLLLLGGTQEGRCLAERLVGWPVEVTVSVATDYGAAALPRGVKILVGRLDQAGMESLLRQGFDLAVDATHPYATQVTSFLREACRRTDVPYLRLRREEEPIPESAVCFPTLAAAVPWLAEQEGTILLATGSKGLPLFAQFPQREERLYARVLPMEESLEACRAIGLPTSHILALQGPFSREMDEAMLRHTGARLLVTKSSGAAGGFGAKAAAAAACGARLVVISRPCREEGLTWEPLLAQLEEWLKR